MNFKDAVSVSNIRRTDDGYLVAEAKVARTGIQEYLARELGLSDRDPNSVIRVYRPESEVFSQETMRSFAHRPMTLGHPNQMVNADNWKAVAIGYTGDEVTRDGDYVRVPLVMMDAAAIKAVEDGVREFSMGYTAEIVFQDGVTPEGEPYDAIQTQIKNNHLALVSRGRAGSECRIGDTNQPRETTMSELKTQTVLVDGLSVVTTDQGAQAIAKLQQSLTDAQAKFDAAQAKYDAAIAAKDAELAKKDAKIRELEGQVLSDADIDKRVTERADLIATAKKIADVDYTGKSVADIRRTAVIAKLGDESFKDKSEAYVEAYFDMLAKDAAKDPVTRQMSDRVPSNIDVSDSAALEDAAYQKSVARFQRKSA